MNAGRIAPGLRADLVGWDLDDPSICGADVATLISNLVFSAERTALREVWISGKQVVEGGRHVAQENTLRDFRAAMKRLWA